MIDIIGVGKGWRSDFVTGFQSRWVVYSGCMKTYRNFVNGKYVDAADGRTIPVINPSTEEQYATAPL